MRPSLFLVLAMASVVAALIARTHWHLAVETVSGSGSGSGRESHGRALACLPLTKAAIGSVAKENTVMVATVERYGLAQFGASFVDNLRTAGITNYILAALDSGAQRMLLEMGENQCVRVPQEIVDFNFEADGLDGEYMDVHVPGQ